MILTPRCLEDEAISTGWVAQLVEHRTENPGVAGSIPARTTSKKPSDSLEGFFIFTE